MAAHAATSRPKPPPPGEEEAGTVLKLGEFEGVETLSLSEASLVINALVAKRRNDRKNVNETECVALLPALLHHFPLPTGYISNLYVGCLPRL